MITFNDFLETKKNEAVIAECANLMADMEVNPYVYIYESLKKVDPVLAEGWWDGVKNFASNAWQGVKQFAGNVAQGVKAGYNQAADTIAGPVAKFDSAIRALEDLKKVLSNNDFSNFMSSTGRGTVAQFVDLVKNSLEKDKGSIPQRSDTKVSQPYATRDQVAAQRAGEPATRPSPVLGADGKPMVVPAAS